MTTCTNTSRPERLVGRLALAAAAAAVLTACSVEADGAPTAPAPAPPTVERPAEEPPPEAPRGQTFANAEDAPSYAGEAYASVRLFDAERGLWLDELALLEALDASRVVYFGEQHETAPVQELSTWLFARLVARHTDTTLAMEHFQHDEQPVVDRYLAGEIDRATFERTSDPWPRYATFWAPLVEHARESGRRVHALNVPEELFDTVYAQYPKPPLDVVNALAPGARYGADVAPRPLGRWSAEYEAYFASSFDYQAHGAKMGMTYAEALAYFVALAHVRDATMGHFAARAAAAGERVFVVAGDWHVQTGLALPDAAAARLEAPTPSALVTTTPAAKLDALLATRHAGRAPARFVLAYEVP